MSHFGFQKSIKINQYADDTILYLNNEQELQLAFLILNEFGSLSGLRLNQSKSEGLWLGSLKHLQLNCSKFGIKWPSQIKYLGIYVGHDKVHNDYKNWDVKIQRLEQILETWSKRDLSLIGRVQIIKSLALSQLTLAATCLQVPSDAISRINKLLFRFIWRSNDKVKRVAIYHPIANGGLNMTDIQSMFASLKAKWINRIITASPEKDSWVQLPYHYFKDFEIERTKLKFNFDESVRFDDIHQLPKFYAEAFESYNRAYATDKATFLSNILNESLFGNKFITKTTRQKKCVLYLRNWVRSGIRKISDLRFQNGKLPSRYRTHLQNYSR